MDDDGRYKHGTLQGYHRIPCRCRPCLRAKNHRRYVLHSMVQAGDFSRCLVDVTEAREHLRSLLDRRMSTMTIVEASGVSVGSIHRILRKPGSRATGAVVARILATECKPSMVPKRASTLRVQSLYALGYSQKRLLAMLGRGGRNLNVHTQREWMTRKKAEAILVLAKEIGDTPGPDDGVRKRAARLGYRVPADFDVDQFYDVDWNGIEDDLEPETRADALIQDAEEIERMLREPSNGVEMRRNHEIVEQRLGVSYSYIAGLRRRKRLAA